MILYGILMVIDMVAAAILLAVFAWGLVDGTVTSVNILPWLLFVGMPVGIVCAGWVLRARGRTGAAITVLLVLAIPSAGAGLSLAALFLEPSAWR